MHQYRLELKLVWVQAGCLVPRLRALLLHHLRRSYEKDVSILT